MMFPQLPNQTTSALFQQRPRLSQSTPDCIDLLFEGPSTTDQRMLVGSQDIQDGVNFTSFNLNTSRFRNSQNLSRDSNHHNDIRSVIMQSRNSDYNCIASRLNSTSVQETSVSTAQKYTKLYNQKQTDSVLNKPNKIKKVAQTTRAATQMQERTVDQRWRLSLLNSAIPESQLQIIKGCEMVERNYLINDEAGLQKKLHKSIPRQDKQFTLRMVARNKPPEVYKRQQTKYIGLGEIGDYYDHQEHLQKQKTMQKERALLNAAKSRVLKPWTTERVAKLIGCQKQMLLHEFDRPDTKERNKRKFTEQVKNYVDDLANNKNFKFSRPGSKHEDVKSPLLPLIADQNKIVEQFGLQKLAEQLVGKIEFQKLCKQALFQQSCDYVPDVQYANANAQGAAKDMLGRIVNKHLVLQELILSDAQCIGFMHACESDCNLLTSILMDNNTLHETEQFLQGLATQRKLHHVVVRRQHLTNQATAILSSVVLQVVDLRIEKCQIQNVTSLLVAASSNIQLQKLALVGISYNADQVQMLTDLVSKGNFTELDLSHSRVFNVQMLLPLLTQIPNNRDLQQINLSWTILIKNSCAQTEMLTEHEQGVFRALARIVKLRSCVHVDYSETGLGATILTKLITPIKNARSLLCIHLSGNTGLSKTIEADYIEKLNAVCEKPLNLISFQQCVDRKGAHQDLRQAHQHLERVVMESLFLKSLSQAKQSVTNNLDGSASLKHFILTRKLGHQLEIPGSQQWRLYKHTQDECYICDRRIYSIFFWSPYIGQVEASLLGLSQEDQTKISKAILDNRHIQPMEEVKNCPQLFGKFNNWTPQPMLPISYIAESLDRNKPNFVQVLHQAGQCKSSHSSVNQLDPEELQLLAQLKQEHYSQHTVITEALLKLLVYKKPHLTPVGVFKDLDFRSLHVAANFVSSGKQDYVVMHNDNLFFNSTITNFRTEDIVSRPIEQENKERIPRHPNVFAKWRKDTHAVVEACCHNDFAYWKIDKFVKDHQDQQQVKAVIQKNYIFIKDIFTIASAKSNFPCVSSIESGLLMNDCGLLSKDFHQGIVDTQFIASRTDVEKRGYKVHQQLALDCNRFEFLECFVRLAQNKFSDVPIGEAVSKLVSCMTPNYKGLQAQDFRNDFLWTREANLTLEANLASLQQLYSKLKRNNKMSKLECLYLLTKQCSIQLSDNDALYCYAMSLQSCVDIMKQTLAHQLHIEFIEFLEMAGRAALKYNLNPEVAFHEKLNEVLDEWLGLGGLQRKPAKYFEDDEDSDDY